MKPGTTLVARCSCSWGLADLVLLPRRQALDLQVPWPFGFALRVAALVLFLANWVYLIGAGR